MTSPPHTLEAETGPDPVASIIVMHGLGADGSDFAPFVDEIDLRPIGPVRWLFPNAPQQPVTINGQTWNRVRLGPFASATELESAKQRLNSAGIHAIALKEK